jgi:transposase
VDLLEGSAKSAVQEAAGKMKAKGIPVARYEAVKIFVRPGSTDLRKAVTGLSGLIQEGMKQDPLSGSVYLFCNRDRKLLKAVWWDKTGFWLSQKRRTKVR